MDNQDLSFSESQENVVGSQDTTVKEPVNAESEEVATPQTDSKPVQTPEQNAEFAKVRRETEAKFKERQDKFAQQYGYDSFEEMERAESDKQFEQKHGVTKEAIKEVYEELKKEDPDFQELSTSRTERSIKTALTDLNNELKDAGVDLQLKDLSPEEVAKIPNTDKVIEYVNKGHSLADAFFLANKKTIISQQTAKTQQETLKNIAANGVSSPGSLSSTQSDDGKYFTPEQVDSMSTADVKRNYAAVMASMKKWK